MKEYIHPITGFSKTKIRDKRTEADILLENRISRSSIKKYVGNAANLSLPIYQTLTFNF